MSRYTYYLESRTGFQIHGNGLTLASARDEAERILLAHSDADEAKLLEEYPIRFWYDRASNARIEETPELRRALRGGRTA